MKIAEKIRQKFIRDFFICGVAGWCLEILFTSVESIMTQDWRLIGKTSLLMFPIYGFGALLGPICRMADHWLDEGILEKTAANVRDLIFRHGMLDMVLIFLAEYGFGMVLRFWGICPWDYTGRPTNVNGLIRLDFAPLWFGTGLLFEQITKKSFEKYGKNRQQLL